MPVPMVPAPTTHIFVTFGMAAAWDDAAVG
jgi:hypothetical protein